MNNNQRRTDRNADIVFCIDGTASMANCIYNLKEKLLEFPKKIKCYWECHDGYSISLRVKLIIFRDYGNDANAMEITDFYKLPEEEETFMELLNNIEFVGGGDSAENGLEALYYAMKSDFYTNIKGRQIIVLFTDSDALPLLERKDCMNYPKDMVNETELLLIWECAGENSKNIKLNNRLKRLIMFAPEGSKYENLSLGFCYSYFKPIKPGIPNEIYFDDIIELLFASVCY